MLCESPFISHQGMGATMTFPAFVKLALAALAVAALSAGARATTYNIVSDTHWSVTDSNGSPLGNAQNVCLNASAPVNCPGPANATLYGYTLPAWAASLPGAHWIWAPNITGTTSHAGNAEFTFEMDFWLCGNPARKGGTISVAADNSAEVFLNSVSVLTATSNSTPATVHIPASALHQGLNPIRVKVKNGPNPGDCTTDTYQCNPAGLLFRASFEDELAKLPTCSDPNNKMQMTFSAGQFEPLDCPVDKPIGSAFQLCACFGNMGFWAQPVSNCSAPPPATCTGSDGTAVPVGTQDDTCPPQTHGFRVCSSNGTWDTSNCTIDASAPPPPPPKMLNAGDVCGSSATGMSTPSACPPGTLCQSRRIPPPPRPGWCIFFDFSWLIGIPPSAAPDACHPQATQTTDLFCDPE